MQYASLPWEVGFRKAKEYLFTGDWIDAREAERLGLVNRVVARDALEEETMALAQRIALQDPFALRLSKASVNQMQDAMGFRNGINSAFQTHSLSDESATAATPSTWAKARSGPRTATKNLATAVSFGCPDGPL